MESYKCVCALLVTKQVTGCKDNKSLPLLRPPQDTDACRNSVGIASQINIFTGSMVQTLNSHWTLRLGYFPTQTPVPIVL